MGNGGAKVAERSSAPSIQTAMGEVSEASVREILRRVM